MSKDKDQKNVNKIIKISEGIYNKYPIDNFGYLFARWQDEKEFEDFAEYEKVMKKNVGEVEGVKFVKASKRPFGFTLKITQEDIWVDYRYVINSNGEFYRQRLKYGRVA